MAVEPNKFNTDKLNDFRAMSNQKVFPTMRTNSFNSSNQAEKSGSMYNYNVNVTLNGSDMDANDVANVLNKSWVNGRVGTIFSNSIAMACASNPPIIIGKRRFPPASESTSA